MKTTYLNLHDKPNRRAEFWSDSDKGPVLAVWFLFFLFGGIFVYFTYFWNPQ